VIPETDLRRRKKLSILSGMRRKKLLYVERDRTNRKI
jgi:hypothetical protein